MPTPRREEAPRLEGGRGAERGGRDTPNVPPSPSPANPLDMPEGNASAARLPANVWQRQCPCCLRWFRVTRGERQRTCLAAVLARQAERFRERYASDPDFRELVKRRARDTCRRRIEKDTNHNAAIRPKDNEQ